MPRHGHGFGLGSYLKGSTNSAPCANEQVIQAVTGGSLESPQWWFLSQNFGRWQGPPNGIWVVCDYSLSSYCTQRWWGHSNPTCCNQICLNLLLSEEVGAKKHLPYTRSKCLCPTHIWNLAGFHCLELKLWLELWTSKLMHCLWIQLDTVKS